MDKNLTFKKHIQILKTRVNDTLYMLRVLSGIKSLPQTILNIYEAIITNMIIYGASIYGNFSNMVSEFLEITYRKAIRMATGYSETAPIIYELYQ